MDPITMAIVGALGKLGESVILDAYQALKAAIAIKCGLDSDVVDAINHLEQKPASAGRRQIVQEEVEAAEILDDPTIAKLAQVLLQARLGSVSGERSVVHQIAGDNVIQIGSVGGDINIQGSDNL